VLIGASSVASLAAAADAATAINAIYNKKKIAVIELELCTPVT